MFSYLFLALKKPVADGLQGKANQNEVIQNEVIQNVSQSQNTTSLGEAETVAEAAQNTLEADNEQLKAQIKTLLSEKAELEKTIKNIKRDSELYRDLMFTKVCACNN
jgi:predicted  nucleic acid-binding Zn-ribbon protein